MSDLELEALWKKVVDDWDSDAAHGAFVEHCQLTDQLLEAAVRYRGMSGDRDRGPSAKKRLEGISLLALAKLEAARTTMPEARKNAGRILLILFFVAGTMALLIAYYR